MRVEGLYTCRQTAARFIKPFIATGTIAHKEGSGRPSKITDQVLQLVEQRMREDDETTATQLHVLLTFSGVQISLSTILRSRTLLGWTFRGSKYCQLIQHANKFKRFQWAMRNLYEALTGGFEDVIWTDEATVQLESHRRHSYRKKGECATLKPRAKHPTKVHVWAGIRKKADRHFRRHNGRYTVNTNILQKGLLPFIRDTYPDSHRFMQDNDPKHTSKAVGTFLSQEGVNWWKTPAESPDMNPIENLWHELKEYIRREVKPINKSELILGIKRFWDTVTLMLRNVVNTLIISEKCSHEPLNLMDKRLGTDCT